MVYFRREVNDEGDYPERTLYYWACEFSSALKSGGEYKDLPRTIIISIVAFEMFDCEEFQSEFQPLEVKRHTPLSDRQVLYFFELPKLPEVVNGDDELKLWLALFNAETEDDLKKIEKMGVSVMNEAIGAYRQVSATEEFRELERQRHYAEHNRASALGHARREGVAEGRVEGRVEGYREADEKWQGVVAEQAAQIAELRAKLGL